jgi:uncharacterized short protein YbdD (DUF466 family)
LGGDVGVVGRTQERYAALLHVLLRRHSTVCAARHTHPSKPPHTHTHTHTTCRACRVARCAGVRVRWARVCRTRAGGGARRVRWHRPAGGRRSAPAGWPRCRLRRRPGPPRPSAACGPPPARSTRAEALPPHTHTRKTHAHVMPRHS